MENNKLFQELLNLDNNWEIQEISKDETTSKVDITVSYKPRFGTCPKSGEHSPVYDYRKSRTWQHLPLFEYQTYIHCQIPRIKNSKGEVHSLEVPWAEPSKRYTFLFGKFVIDLLSATFNQTKTAVLARTSFDVVNRIMHGSVERGMARREFLPGEIVLLGIDEKQFNNGHNYISILVDLKNQRILDVELGRTKESTEKLITKSLTGEQRKQIRAVSMDMWESYMVVVTKLMPTSDIVHDKFHIVKYLKEAIDKHRKNEVKKEPLLKGSRYTMLKNQENRTPNQYEHFEDIMASNLKTAKAWAQAETFKEVLDCYDQTEALAYFDMWVDSVRESGLRFMKKVANTFENHLEGILNYVKHKITNAKTERFNGKIQTLKSISRGYRSFDNFRSAILFFYGKLDLYSHKFQ